MRWILITVIIASLAIFGYFQLAMGRLPSLKGTKQAQYHANQGGKNIINEVTRESVFVPYWQLPLDEKVNTSFHTNAKKRAIYFGVSAAKDGINKDEEGYLKLVSSWKRSEIYDSLLTLRMLDSDINDYILAHPESQQSLITDSVQVAKEFGFQGVALDLEQVSLFDTTSKERINEFVERFYSTTQESNLQLSLIIYGDVYYRKRPYDLVFLSQHADEVMLMAYDFHKSRGEPGPNFPLEGKEQYGYDYHVLVDNVLKDVPRYKLTIIFGLYGYDWIVDEQKRPYKTATSMTYAQIEDKYISQCKILNCVIERDKASYENEINFVDSSAQYHIVWYEDWISVDAKTEYLKENGVGSIAYWAYGYY